MNGNKGESLLAMAEIVVCLKKGWMFNRTFPPRRFLVTSAI